MGVSFNKTVLRPGTGLSLRVAPTHPAPYPDFCTTNVGAPQRCARLHTFDIIDYNHQPNQKLKEAIDRDGILLWAKKGDGSIVMTDEILQLKREEYHKALTRLQSALQKEPDDDMVLDATIQRFEFTFELAWKLLKALLDYEGIEATSPRSCIREAWKQHLIKNAEQWLDMQTKRDLSSHTYNEATALEIYRSIKEKYIDLLTELDQMVEATLTNVGADR